MNNNNKGIANLHANTKKATEEVEEEKMGELLGKMKNITTIVKT